VNVFIVSASGDRKPQFWANFYFWGILYRTLFTDEVKSGVLWLTHSTRLRVKIRLDLLILSPSGGETPQFLPFLDFVI